MNRRHVLGALVAAASSLAVAGTDKIYLNYSQQELDDAYTDAVWAPNMREQLGAQAQAGAKVRTQFPPKTISYGSEPNENMHVFVPQGASGRLSVMIFIHGGNWRFGSKESVSLLAPPFLSRDAIYVAPEFDPLPANTLPGMVDQCRRAVLWVRKNAAEFGADPERIYVGGHSAGGHVAALMLTTEWARLDAPANLLKGGLLLSGLGDLEPALLARGNSHVKLTARERVDLSPIHKFRAVNCPVIVAWGSGDSPEFKRQSMLMARELRAVGRLAGSYFLENTNHFDILDVLASDRSALSAGTLALMT